MSCSSFDIVRTVGSEIVRVDTPKALTRVTTACTSTKEIAFPVSPSDSDSISATGGWLFQQRRATPHVMSAANLMRGYYDTRNTFKIAVGVPQYGFGPMLMHTATTSSQ